MNRIKNFIKKYFSSFAFFYRYLRNRVFVAFGLSLGVSILDGLGLTMFFPLLQAVDSGNGASNTEGLGKMKILIEALNNMGVQLTLGIVLIVMLLFFFGKGILQYLSSVYIIILQQSFIRKMRLKMLYFFNQMSFKKFIKSDAGRIQNTMSGEIDRVASGFSSYFQAFQQGIMVVVYMSFAFIVNFQFAILVTIGGALTNVLYRIIYQKTKGASRKLTSYNHVFQGQIIQYVANFKYLRATGSSVDYGKRLEGTIYDVEASRKRIGVLSSIGSAAREPLLVAVIATVIYLQFHFLGGSMAAIMISLLFFYRALTSLVALQQGWNFFMSLAGSMENVQDFQKMLKQSREKDGKIKIKEFKNAIELRNLSFSYSSKKIIKDINLNIPRNTSIAFVGESGSGKTTLVNLLSGLLPESSGVIEVDGIPLKNLNKESYQKRIGYVSQESVIFNDTIYNNVTFWAEKTPENIARFQESIKKAAIDQFIEEQELGKDTILGNNGINLSGGQKQRISIARELYKEIDILILDEATSALDSATEKEIQKSIDALQGQYTIIMVAHRLSTIKNVDRVVLMDRGRIVDSDTFDNLVNKQERFRRMVELQDL